MDNPRDSVRFSGPIDTDQQSDPFSCAPESLDSALRFQSSDEGGFGGIGVTAGSLSFGCLRLIADDGAIDLYGFSNSYNGWGGEDADLYERYHDFMFGEHACGPVDLC